MKSIMNLLLLLFHNDFRYKYDGCDCRYPLDYTDLYPNVERITEIQYNKYLLDIITNNISQYVKIDIINTDIFYDIRSNIYTSDLLDDWNFDI